MPTYAMTVTVRPEYLPSRSAPADDIYVFAYHITVTNIGEMAAQLISRTWNINDANGMHEKVKGLGLVGQQPLLQPGEQFQYTSGCHLRTATGTMHGSFFCVTDAGAPFSSPVALFMLEANDTSRPEQPLGPRVLH